MLKKIIFVLFVITIAGSLFAQSPGFKPMEQISSPAALSTFNLIGLPVDDILSPVFYNTVDFKRWIGYVSFASGLGQENSTAERGVLGSALKIGNVHLGLYYGGNFGYGFFEPDYIEMNVAGNLGPKGTGVAGGGWGNAANTELKKFKVFMMPHNSSIFTLYDTFDKNASHSPHDNDNRVIALLGINNMGFKLGYASTYTRFIDSDVAIEYDVDPLDPNRGPYFYYYKNFAIGHGWTVYNLAWGMANDLTPMGLRPYLGIDFGIARNFNRYVDYQKTGETVQYSKNYFEPVFTAAVYGYNYYDNNDGLSLSADLEYQLTLRLFNNDYSYGPITDQKLGNIKGFADRQAGSPVFNEYEYSSNKITPSTKLSWTQGNLDMRVLVSLPITITSEKDSPMLMVNNTTGDLINDFNPGRNIQSSQSIFSIAPCIELAIQYRVFSDKLNLNIGGFFRQTGIGFTVTEYTEYTSQSAGTASAPSNQYTRHQTNLGNFETALHAGFTILFSEKFAIDATTGIRNGRDINVFGTGAGSITNFGSIMAMITF